MKQMMIEIIEKFYLFLLLSSQFSKASLKIAYLQPEQIHLSLGEYKDSMIVTWTTNNYTTSECYYGLSPHHLSNHSVGTSKKFKPSLTRKEYIHTVSLNSLPFNTTIYYHVGSSLGISAIFWFTTFPRGNKWSPTIALYGDLGNENAQSLPRLQRETEAGLYDAIIHVGDFAYDMETDDGKVGDEFMKQIQSIAAYVPYMTTNGNHEQANNFSHYKARFSMPGDNGSLFYSFDIGPIHFISISTEFYYFLNYGIHPLIRQYTWLQNELQTYNSLESRKNHPWLIVFGHRPMYCSNSNKDDCTRQNCLTRVGLPLLKIFGLEDLLFEHKVDLAIWAHEHDYERFWPLYNNKILNGTIENPYVNPKAPVHIITGSAGCREKHDDWKPVPNITAFRSLDYGYTRLSAVNQSHLHIQQISDDKNGKIIDDFWIVKV